MKLRNSRTVAGGGPYLMHDTALAKHLSSGSAEPQPINHLPSVPRRLWAIGLALLSLPGCNALNPLCASSRPAPVISTLSASTITFAQLQQGFLLTVNGREFVASSVVIINGTTLSTTVQSNQRLLVTIPTDLVSGAGAASVTVNTPAGNSGYLGCSSGGTSSALTLTIT